MSIVEQEDELKGVPDDRLVSEMQNPTGMFPAYLVFTEINRREESRSRFAGEQAQMPTASMAEEAVSQMMNGGLPPQQPMEQGLGQGMPQDMQGMQGMQGMPPGMDQGMPPGMPPGMDQGMPPMAPPGMDQGIASGPPMQMMSNGGMVRGFVFVRKYPWLRGYEDLDIPDNVLSSLAISEESIPGSASSYLEGISRQRTTSSPSFRSERDEAIRERTSGLDTGTTFGLFPSERSLEKERLRPLITESILSGAAAKTAAAKTAADKAAADKAAKAAADKAAKAAADKAAGDGPPAAEEDPLAGLRTQSKAFQNFDYKPDPNAESDMSDLRAMLEELNPAPSRNNMFAQSLMQLGSGLMQSPTWQGGLGKGFDQVSQTVGEYGEDMREYNQRQSITEQALFEADRARADKYRENQFRDRKQGFDADLSLAGLEQRAELEKNRLASLEERDTRGDDFRLLIALNKQLNEAITDADKDVLREKIVRVNARIDGYGGGRGGVDRGRIVP